MNPKLEAISVKAAEDLQDLIKNHEEKILEAWDQAEEEAQLQESAPKFKLGFTVTLDLDKDSMESALTFGIRYKAVAQAQIPDPDQGKLPLDGGVTKVTLKTPGMEPVVIDGNAAEMLRKTAKKLRNEARS